MIRSIRRAAMLALTLAAAAAGGLDAQELPDAASLLKKYHEAINAAAYANVKATHTTGEFSMPAQGISASFDAWGARPNRSAAKVTIPGIGEMRMGFTDGRGWSMSSFEGARLYQGAEQTQAADDSHFDSSLRPASLVASMTTVEKTQLGGQECWKVRVVWKSGRETHDCYASDSGLLVGTMYRSETNAGSGDAVTLYSDYREFGGIRLPTRMTTQAMGMEQVITVRAITFDSIDDAALEPPPAIRTLLGGK